MPDFFASEALLPIFTIAVGGTMPGSKAPCAALPFCGQFSNAA